ncbi:hypothetical protein CALCODRAFT_495003 [Calocera cornea HHB12733]|uniref:Uncharacterized protein n=1 Tax=Calocera cornea HHB12733 TaxID=1353952 RepID=A0A165GNS6_9BASI|nr:hypothetical protein CALCODRAFT_495003 [Calocera cornea HHB12733]
MLLLYRLPSYYATSAGPPAGASWRTHTALLSSPEVHPVRLSLSPPVFPRHARSAPPEPSEYPDSTDSFAKRVSILTPVLEPLLVSEEPRRTRRMGDREISETSGPK